MKTETFYRKVEIRTADDLPTERGFYFVHYKKHLMDVKHWPTIHPVEWAEDIDWYLQPEAMESYHKEKLREGLIAYEKFLGMNEEDFMKSIDRFLNSR